MEYKILESGDRASSTSAICKLEEKVNTFCEEGWKPQGGIAVTIDEFRNCTAFQAMVK